MITLEKLEIYWRYNGDGDARVRSNSDISCPLTYEEWSTIDDIIKDLKTIKSGYAPLALAINVDNRIIETFDNEKTIAFLHSMVK